MKLDKLPWIDISPYDQVLTDLVSSCQHRDASLICVQGPNGSGKSRILTELLSTLSFDSSASLIVLHGEGHEVFYHNVEVVSELLCLNDPKFLHHLTLTLESILKDKQHFYLLIDDVEVLPYELIEGIINLLNENLGFKQQITLVVFMGVAPIHLETQHLLASAKVITLKGMSITQAKQFIDKVYHYTNQSKELTMSEVNHLHGLSYGYAGRLIKLLEEYLVSVPESKSYQSWWRAVIVLLIPLVGLIVWFQYHVQNKDSDQESTLESLIIDEPILVKKEIVPVKIITPMSDVLEKQSELEVKFVKADFSPNKPNINNSLLDVNNQNMHDNVDKKITQSYVIELDRHPSKVQLEKNLKGRSIPGKAQFIQSEIKGSKVWIAYIGPYGSEEQAVQGKNKLPASLQSLPLKVRKEF